MWLAHERYAFLSIFREKLEGTAEFALDLARLDFGIIASEGTARYLVSQGVRQAVDIRVLTGKAPAYDHRMATISWPLFSAILARELDREEVLKDGYPWIDLVNVEVYPLADEIAKPSATLESVREKIDIGGPSALNAAAKSGRLPLIGASYRQEVLDCLRNGEEGRTELQLKLAAKTYQFVSEYYGLAGKYLNDYVRSMSE